LDKRLNFLSEIISKKHERVEAAKQLVTLDQQRTLAAKIRTASVQHAFRAALRKDSINIIAEFKRRSPSKGMIRSDANLDEIVRKYEEGGAVAVSVLTEEDYFDGSLEDLQTVRASVKLAVLRKDFLFEEYQVYEAAAAGADAVLLIVAALEDEPLFRLRQLAEQDLGMDALVEVHTEEEMERASETGATLIGINNRDLHTFEVSLDTSVRLAAKAPERAVLISESGLRVTSDLKRLKVAGFSGFLIGESLMRADDPARALKALMSDSQEVESGV
jgi:indole-3-glycerol phosphate synthase